MHLWDMWDHNMVGPNRRRIHEQLGERKKLHGCAFENESTYIIVCTSFG
jgi:hypothetical protein